MRKLTGWRMLIRIMDTTATKGRRDSRAMSQPARNVHSESARTRR